MDIGGRRRRLRSVIVPLVVITLLSGSALVGLYVDALWFEEVGFSAVFWKILSTKAILGALFALAFLAFALINLAVVSRSIPPAEPVDPNDVLYRYRQVLLPYFKRLAIGIGSVLALMFGLGLTAQWERVLLALNATSFGSSDPVFHRDLSFFVFKLPMYRVLYNWAFSAVVIVTLIVAAAHYLTGGIHPQSAFQKVTPAVKAHLSVLIGLIALIRAWGYRLDQFGLMFSTRGDVTGASFTDINAELPALKLLVIISVIAALLFLVNIRFKGWTLPLAGLGLWLLTAVLAAGAFPFVVQRFRVEPAQFQKEKPFIQRNIKATRAAYGLDKVNVSQYPGRNEITPAVVAANSQTIDNIRLFDPAILKQAYRQLEEFQTYYEFKDVDVDRYQIEGKTRQVMLSVRELDLAVLGGKSWAINHALYTHGHGVVVSPTNEVSDEGRPRFFSQSIPSESEFPELKLKEAGIYYGEGDTEYSLVRTDQQELDYDERERSRYTEYSGKGGVLASALGRRAAFAWQFKDINLLISGLIDSDTKILYRRQIKDRLSRAAPFLSFDTDPYPVVANGRVVWIADGFTSSDMYPYSERMEFGQRVNPERRFQSALDGSQNYVRNSVKATVDAYDGSIHFYDWDDKDPLIKSWRKAFPDLFEDGSKMPAELQKHVRYPVDLFRIQSLIYSKYHVTDPSDFFARKNRWVIPTDPNHKEEKVEANVPEPPEPEVQPYYVLMRLPGAAEENYILITPMNPLGKPNMVSYLSANSDPEDYGTLTDFRFPKTKTVFGVGQIHSRINADPIFSRERTLLDQGGSKLLFGNLLVVPIEESILYVQPLFLQAEKDAIPELKFVALATGTQVVLGKTLEEAVSLLVEGRPPSDPAPGQGPPPAEPPKGEAPATGGTAEELNKQALDHLNRAKQALKDGDFAAFGRELEEATRLLEQTGQSSASSDIGQ